MRWRWNELNYSLAIRKANTNLQLENQFRTRLSSCILNSIQFHSSAVASAYETKIDLHDPAAQHLCTIISGFSGAWYPIPNDRTQLLFFFFFFFFSRLYRRIYSGNRSIIKVSITSQSMIKRETWLFILATLIRPKRSKLYISNQVLNFTPTCLLIEMSRSSNDKS